MKPKIRIAALLMCGSGDIVTNFGISGPATHAGFTFIFRGAWQGTIYVDDVKIF